MVKRVAVVTGGMGGLGESICIKLCELGDTVVATYSPSNTKAQAWLKEMREKGYDVHAVPADVSDFESCKATVDKVQIASGLKAGEQVITEGADRLRDGASVVLPGDKPGGGRGAGQGGREGAGRPARGAPQ